MSLETDLLLDRRRLKRRLSFWRVLAVLGLCAAVAVAVWRSAIPGGIAHVSRLTVSGFITDDRKIERAIARLADDRSSKALIVYIDSSGGSVAGGEGLHDAIARVAKRKPVVAVMGGMATSAGYMVAAPAERIFAREATLTGSIGVLFYTPDISGLLQKVGIGSDLLVSGPLKAQPSMVRPLSPAGREMLQQLITDLYEQFVAIVAEGRHLDAARVRELADGRPYTGRQALKLGLVDQIGGETDARAWLAQAKGVSANLPVRDVTEGGLAERLLVGGLAGTVGTFVKSLLSQGLMVDGALAVWQPGLRPTE
jgi:protease IV